MTTLAATPVRIDTISIHPEGADAISLPLTTSSAWSALLAGAPAPADDALDRLARALADFPLARVTLRGPAFALALPILWLRSLGADPIAIEPIRSDDPPQFEHLASLARSLADDSSDVRRVADPIERADLLGAIFDSIAHAADAPSRASTALHALAARGRRRVAIYGAGRYTERLAPALMRAPVEILCVIDDNPALAGRRLWGFPILPLERAMALPLDAVLLSADSIEDALWDRCASLRSRGVEVVRLAAPGA